MNERFFVLAPPQAFRGMFAPLHARELDSPEQVRRAFWGHSRSLWIAPQASAIGLLTAPLGYPRRQECLLVMEPVESTRLQFLGGLFRRVVAGARSLPSEELVEVLLSANRRDLFIGGEVDSLDKVLVLYRGDLTPTLVPFSWFRKRPASPEPDFSDFSVIDFGQTVRLGEYEAATDAILYEFDADFRRRDKKRWIQQDDSFGGALRRLRLQRGFSRSDFSPLSAKEIARIERGEVGKPHKETLGILADRLGVRAGAIASY